MTETLASDTCKTKILDWTDRNKNLRSVSSNTCSSGVFSFTSARTCVLVVALFYPLSD